MSHKHKNYFVAQAFMNENEKAFMNEHKIVPSAGFEQVVPGLR